MVLKRATKKLQTLGYNLEVHKGIYGPYLYDTVLNKPIGRCYKTADEAITAAIETQKPDNKGKSDF